MYVNCHSEQTEQPDPISLDYTYNAQSVPQHNEDREGDDFDEFEEDEMTKRIRE